MSKIIFLLALFIIPVCGVSQDTQDYRNFPVVITIQFQSFSMPFQNLKGHFRNVGIGIGTEVSHNGGHDWVQHFDLIWFRNKTMGNGLLLTTQSGWRPYISNPLYSAIKLGVAYFHSFRTDDSFQQKNGEWINVGKKGKGIFAIPTGIALGYHDYREAGYVSPFLGYQFMLTTNYAKSLPVTPWSIIQVGSSYNPK